MQPPQPGQKEHCTLQTPVTCVLFATTNVNDNQYSTGPRNLSIPKPVYGRLFAASPLRPPCTKRESENPGTRPEPSVGSQAFELSPGEREVPESPSSQDSWFCGVSTVHYIM